jgi:S1-C subfamily serine protease
MTGWLCATTCEAQTPSATIRIVSRGTGFFISPEGLLVTAAHVTRDHDRLLVVVDGRPVKATLLREDRAHDLAILKVDRSPVPYLTLGRSDNVPVGLEIYTIGYPGYPQATSTLRMQPRFSSGILSADSGPGESPDYFQFTAPVAPGISGGPLLSGDLSVVGVVVSLTTTTVANMPRPDIIQNVNFAIKSAHVATLLQAIGASAPAWRSIDPQSERRPFQVFQEAWRAVVPVLAANLPPSPATGSDAATGEAKP